MNPIEPLESRIAPAIVASVNHGTLNIQHVAASLADTITVTQTGAGTFTVTDTDGPFNASFTGVKSINAVLGGTDDLLTFNFGKDGLAGSLKINPGDGTNKIALQTVAGAGRVAGSVGIIGGIDGDSLTLGGDLAFNKSLQFIGNGGADEISGGGFRINKTLRLDNVEDITFQSGEPVVMGAFDADNDEAATSVVFVFSNIVAVKGKLTYCGNGQADSVTLAGQIGGAAELMLEDGVNTVSLASRMGSTLKITGGAQGDSITFTDAQTALGNVLVTPNNIFEIAKAVKMNLGEGANSLGLEKGAHLANSLSYIGGNSSDTINFDSFFLQKNMTLKTGGGANAVQDNNNLDHYIGGALKYLGGSGNDTLGLTNLVAGTLSAKLGDGTNNVTASMSILGKKVSIIGGNTGSDTITADFDSGAAKLAVKLNGGADSFSYVAGGALVSAKLDGGSGTDTLTGESSLPVKRTIKNFEP